MKSPCLQSRSGFTLVEGKTTDQRIAYCHGGKAIVVYYDGSTGLVSPHDICAFDAQGGTNYPFWKANAL